MSRDLRKVERSIRRRRALVRTTNDFAAARRVRKFNFPRVENNPCLGNWLLDPSRFSGSVPSPSSSYPAIFCAGARERRSQRERNSLLLIRPAARNKIKRILKLARANFLAFPGIIFVSPLPTSFRFYAQHRLCLPLVLLFPYQCAKPSIGQTAPEYSAVMRRCGKKER